MENKDIKELQQLLDKFENEDLQNVSKDTKDLQSYSEYEGTTPTEKKVINNSSLIVNSMNNANKISKKLFEINAQIFKSLIKMEGRVDDTEKCINEYLESIKTETEKTIMDYKTKILTSADSEVETFENKQIQINNTCIEKLNKIKDTSKQIIESHKDFLKNIEVLKTDTLKSLKKWSFRASLVPVGASIITAIICCAATFIVFSIMPQIQKAFETFGVTAGIISIVVIIFGVWLIYCFIKGRS